jgi:hypothetical protein
MEDRDRQVERRSRLVPSLSTFAGSAFEARRRRRWWTVACAAAAAVAVLAGGAFRAFRSGEHLVVGPIASVHAEQGDVMLTRAGASPSAIGTATVELAARDRVETTDARAQVNLSSGALFELDARTTLELGPSGAEGSEGEDHVALSIGKIGVRVPKLPAGKTLSVGTPNATVTVHGTVFEVMVKRTDDGASSTAVSVTEGRVSVRSDGHEIYLGPGASWSSLTAPVPAAPSATEAAEAVKESPPRAGTVRNSLAEENHLFRSAMAARLAGKPAIAVQILDRLLASHPDTPLAEAVRAERVRALADIDRARGMPERE